MTDSNDQKEPMPEVAVIGTGTMGTAMARRLLGARMDVHVWSRHPASTMPLVDLGATAFDAASDAARDVDVVITMLATAEATADVMFDGHALDAMKPGSIWVQMATIGVEVTQRLVRETLVQRPVVAFVDAPVSGSREPAEKGQLLILASGPHAAAQSLEPVFGALGRATLWLGPAGAGSAMKLVLNTWLAFQTEGAAEAAALAERLGVPTSALLDVLRDNPLASPYAVGKLARMLEQDFDADFALDWALKDLDLVAKEAGAKAAPVASAIAERWRGLVQNGSSGLDVSAARQGLGGDAPVRRSARGPAWIVADRVALDTRQPVSTYECRPGVFIPDASRRSAVSSTRRDLTDLL
jgi:3-hydroxyisobutyrate dehydrogenase